MKSLIRRIGKRVHSRIFAESLAPRSQCLQLLVAGDVDAAIGVLERANQRARSLTLMESVAKNPNPNHPRVARAPSQVQQVDFFVRARALTKLGEGDDLKYHIALTYQAVEADNRSVVDQGVRFFQSQLPLLKRKRAYTDTFLMGGKRGHHLYYSAVLTLLHAGIATEDFDLFETTTDDAEAFFYQMTMKTKDKGFGWALPNAMRIAGLAALWWRMNGDAARADEKLAMMPEMLRLAIGRKVGPLESAQVIRAVRLLQESQALREDFTPEHSREAFANLVRLRDKDAHERLFRNFTVAAGYS
ncbi:hypothetical protein [Roseovarius sp.]|uniref:hypothetical protein n=1 Tax=Roseovarius sp. TaxID=1486281 RepID=UPI003563415D